MHKRDERSPNGCGRSAAARRHGAEQSDRSHRHCHWQIRGKSATIPLSLHHSEGLRMTSEQNRCAWADNDPLMRAYHDQEWGVPEHDGRALWEKLMLDGFQAGLSWITILRKRAAFRQAFQGFDPAVVARFTEEDITRLLADPSIVRSRAKIAATIGN